MKYFQIDEFCCSHTGEVYMNPDFLDKLDQLRNSCGFPFVITSGYRDPTHPIEAKKKTPGTHAQGIAADIKITTGIERYILLREAFAAGFTGIGIASDFIHVDIRETTPVVWTY